MTELLIDRGQYLELEKLGLGAFHPVEGFMTEDEFRSVVSEMRLPNGQVFPLPIVLDVSEEDASRLRGSSRVALIFSGVEVGSLKPESFYRPDKKSDARSIFGTDDPAHPGVHNFLSSNPVFVGGPIELIRRVRLDISDYELVPEETRNLFRERGWDTIVGFQTRNVPHRAHEYLQRIALEICDGLFVQPLVGRKKAGDYTPQAIMSSYKALIEQFFPDKRVVLGVLSTSMRYAGPREAVFHAIVRRNYGCTHFIVGRDHAGVGAYYGMYDAHELTRRFEGELGIEVLRLHGPYHCRLCDGIVTDNTCPHEETNPNAVTHISGTDMRAMLNGGKRPEKHLMRSEVIDSVKGMPLFIGSET